MRARPRLRRNLDVWPGFVDALTSLLMVMVFVLLVFAIGQSVLSETLGGKSHALDRLISSEQELADALSLSRDRVISQSVEVARLEASLDASGTERDQLQFSLNAAEQQLARLRTSVVSLSELKRQLETTRAALTVESDKTRQATQVQATAQISANDQISRLSLQTNLLREQLARVGGALVTKENDRLAKGHKIAELGHDLDVALLDKASRLERYRSEFFGKLREALGSRRDIRIVGDRFVVPTDVLFASGSADLEAEAEASLSSLVTSLREISTRIPKSIDWILRIDGHTDQMPIRSERFPSNWELSTARAVAIVKYLIDQGIPAERLSANGFGEFRPLEMGSGSESLARNRRIELQLSNR